MTDSPPIHVVLASASETRRKLLEAAGVSFDIVPARVDEDEIKASMVSEGATGAEIVEALAEHKGRYVSIKLPGVLVIGADQVLECATEIISKPIDRNQARDQLLRLRGREHQLISCACVLMDGQRHWHHLDRATLRMRDFSDAFLEHYLDGMGTAALDGPGAYRIEGLGSQLFARTQGDHFTILGLPLLPLLDYLRIRGALET